MQSFKFKYASLSKLRKLQEDIAQKNYLDIQTELNTKKLELENLYNQLKSTYYNQTGIRKEKECFSPDCSLMDELAVGLRKKLDIKINDIRAINQRLEEAYEVFLQAHKSRKALEKLREKQKVEYNKTYKKHETKLTDEVVSYKYTRRLMDEKKK